jgi:hypothetical protein
MPTTTLKRGAIVEKHFGSCEIVKKEQKKKKNLKKKPYIYLY